MVNFTDADIKQKARVVVIGNSIKNDLFGNSKAVGEQIQIKRPKNLK